MRTSIRRHFACVTIGVLAVAILLCWFLNNTFLEKYYEKEKKDAVEALYQKLDQAVSQELLDKESFQIEVRQYIYRYNINTAILNSNSDLVFVAAANSDELKNKLLGYIVGIPIVSGETPQPNEVFKVRDVRTGTEYIEMYGELEKGYRFLISSPMESMRESVRISNRFLAYVGVLVVAAGGVLMYLISRGLTRPILELAGISERMTRLDFDAKYEVKGKDEIALLGSNINKLSRSLEQTISELKTANNELKRDIEKKEQIDEMRKEFLSNVSHELKTPIALIQGYAEGLKESINDDPESRDFYCEVIMDEAGKMNGMVGKLLTLNQLEFGNDVVTMERFDITALVSNYLQSAQVLARRSDIEVRMAQRESLYVWADEFKTEEVFANYFSNAVNHCDGPKVIDIKLEKIQDKVQVSVFNTGQPIPQESLEHIWEKFYKVDKARSREYGGSGVGLSIVKAIMESMNQQYGVVNYTNGVLFWFQLEAAESGKAGD